MEVKMSDGTVKDVPVSEVTKENYIVPETEKHLWHLKIEIKRFNPRTAESESKPRIQKVGAKFFASNPKVFTDLGYTVDVLWNPTEYNKEMAKQIGKQTFRKDSKEFQDAVAAEVAKQLADMEAKKRSKKNE